MVHEILTPKERKKEKKVLLVLANAWLYDGVLMEAGNGMHLFFSIE